MRDAELLPAAGRVIAISGAGRGLGAAIARRLHGEGYTLALGVRDPGAARARLGFAERASFHAYDAMQPATAEDWIEGAVATHGRLDGLINNAGILRRVTWDEGGEAELDELWTVNVKSPFCATKAALPHLRAAGHGRVVNIASTDGKRIRDASVSIGYAMSKHALVALSQATKLAGWEEGVRVTALCPGAIDTELLAGLPGISANRLSPATIAEIVSLLLRLPDTATIAELVVNTRSEHSY
jgi:NAD(P)-dependent dehydrogenase (short-subunit alcohol dehydrogenase family)